MFYCPIRGPLAEVAIVPKLEGYVMLTPQVTYYRIGEIDRLSNSYLRYFMESDRFQKTLLALSKQSTRDYIGISQQKKFVYDPTPD